MKSFREYLLESDNNVLQFTATKSKQLFDKLNTAIDNIKEKYAKCMAVVSLLDSNGGNLSEKILAYYLSQEEGINAERVGGDQALTDIVVNIGNTKINISLKTYNSSNNIDLGTHLKLVAAGDVAKIAEKINNDIKKYKVETFKGKNGSEQKAILISSIKDSNIIDAINKRISAITDKLCGSESNPEVFCYIEKIYRNKQLRSFRFNTYAFDRKKITNLLNNGYISITPSAYGIMVKPKDHGYINIVIAQAKNQLTISPVFLKQPEFIKTIIHDGHIDTKTLQIDTNSKQINADKLLAPLYNKSSQDIDDAYIKSLESLYDNLIKPKK